MNKSGRERQLLYDLTYRYNLENKTNEQNRIRLTDTDRRKLVIATGKRYGSGGEQNRRS